VGLCPGSRTITGWADDDLGGRDVDWVWVGFGLVAGELDRGCERLGLVVRRDDVDDALRLAAVVVALLGAGRVDGVTTSEVELVDAASEVLAESGPVVGRELPHAPAVMTVTSAIAIPATRRRAGAEEARYAEVLTAPR
jgi:hypothetical protein